MSNDIGNKIAQERQLNEIYAQRLNMMKEMAMLKQQVGINNIALNVTQVPETSSSERRNDSQNNLNNNNNNSSPCCNCDCKKPICKNIFKSCDCDCDCDCDCKNIFKGCDCDCIIRDCETIFKGIIIVITTIILSIICILANIATLVYLVTIGLA